jgi:hypothetical protein
MKRPTQSVSAIAGIAALGAALLWSYLPLTTSHASNPSPAAEERPATMTGTLARSRIRRCRQDGHTGRREHHHERRRRSG